MTQASPRPRILLVDGDPQARLVAEVTLKASGFEVLAASQGAEALSFLTRETVDVVVADTELAELDGFELCASLRARPEAARLLIVLISADRTQRNRARLAASGADDFLLKPTYAHELDQRLRALLRRRQRERLMAGQDESQPLGGLLGDIAVVDLLTLVEQSGRSGLLTLKGPSGSRGEIYFRQGRVVDAEVGHLSGPEAVYRAMGWSTGSFLLDWKNVRRRDAVAMATGDLLVEGLKRVDEWNRLLEGLPGTATIYEVDYRRLADHLAEIPDEVNAILRLFDGVRTLAQVIEDSGFADLDALRVIRKLVESGILCEMRTAEEPRDGHSNPIFEGWQPEVSAPLSQLPVVASRAPPEDDALALDVGGGLPAPAVASAPSATNPGLGPREAAPATAPPDGGRHSAGRSTALGIPTVEPPAAPEAPDQAALLDADEPLRPMLSLTAAELPTVPAPPPGASSEGADDPSGSPAPADEGHAAESAPVEPAPAPLPRREQTQIFSRRDAMDELGLARTRWRWLVALLAAAVGVGAGLLVRARYLEPEASLTDAGAPSNTAALEPESGASRAVAPVPPAPAPLAAAPAERGPAAAESAPAALPPVDLPGHGGVAAPAAGREAPSHEAPPSVAAADRAPAAAPSVPTAAKVERAPGAQPGRPAGAKVAETKTPPGTGDATAKPETSAPVARAEGAASEGTPVASGDAAKNLGDCKTAFAAGRFRQALALCGDAVKGNPDSAPAYAMLAHAQLNRGKANDALSSAQKAIALDPGQADAYVIIGGVEQDRGHSAAAKAAYLKYLQLAPRGRYAADLRAIVDTL
jgi:CheY-like chemotaxis protein/Flp pilus assembly protein TadD